MAGLDLSIDVGSRLGVYPAMLDNEGLESIQSILQEVIFSWREVMQDSWPRDTGTSFAAWESYVDGLTLVVVNPVPYAEYVHPPGGEVGESGDFLSSALTSLVDAATPAIMGAVSESMARRAGGLADVARPVGVTPRALETSLRVATEEALEAESVLARHRRLFPGVPIGQQADRAVIARTGAAVQRLRERTRVRTRVR